MRRFIDALIIRFIMDSVNSCQFMLSQNVMRGACMCGIVGMDMSAFTPSWKRVSMMSVVISMRPSTSSLMLSVPGHPVCPPAGADGDIRLALRGSPPPGSVLDSARPALRGSLDDSLIMLSATSRPGPQRCTRVPPAAEEALVLAMRLRELGARGVGVVIESDGVTTGGSRRVYADQSMSPWMESGAFTYDGRERPCRWHRGASSTSA